MAATQQVLGISELLESLLIALPTRDLLFAQKVSKSWKHAIDTSPAIQTALFFAPGDAADVSTNINHLAFPRDPAKERAPNPLLFAGKLSDNFDFLIRPRLLNNEALTAPATSCARMLFSQPPCKLIARFSTEPPGDHSLMYKFMHCGPEESCVLYLREGETFEDLRRQYGKALDQRVKKRHSLCEGKDRGVDVMFGRD